MNIKAISKTMIAPLLITCAAACSKTPETNNFAEKAKEECIQYMTAKELLEAEKNAYQYTLLGSECENNPAINYWDSIVTSNKIKLAYKDGANRVKDSIAGIQWHGKYKEEITLNPEINKTTSILNESRNEASYYYNAKDFVELRNNEPGTSYAVSCKYNQYVLHYWNLLKRSYLERKAYLEGMNSEKAKLNK